MDGIVRSTLVKASARAHRWEAILDRRQPPEFGVHVLRDGFRRSGGIRGDLRYCLVEVENRAPGMAVPDSILAKIGAKIVGRGSSISF